MSELFKCTLDNSSSHPFKNVLGNLMSTLIIYILIGFVLYCCFECIRKNSSISDSRRVQQPLQTPLKPLGSWIRPLLCLDDDKDIKKGNISLDYFVILRFISVCSESCIFSTLLSFCILCPVYVTAGSSNGFSSFTIDNV